MSTRILITGTAGLVGQNLVPILVERAFPVTGLDKNRNNLELLRGLNPAAEVHVADLSEEGAWMDLFAGVHTVVDLKAQITAPGTERFQRNNVATQRNVLKACESHGVAHIIHLSSSVVISVAKDAYTESKREAEELVRGGPVPYTILRPPLLYGCFDAKHLGWLTRLLERSPLFPLPGSGRYMRQPLFVLDLCGVVVRCIERGPSLRAHNIIGHERIDFVDIIRTIAREKRLKRAILPIPIPLFAAALRTAAFLTRRPPFTKEQLDALTAGDDFPVEPWAEEFGVPYTPLTDALRQMYASPRYPVSRQMTSPH